MSIIGMRPQMLISEGALADMENTLKRRQEDLDRLRLAMETLAGMNEAKRFKGAAMALCNQIASRWQAERVSLGVLKGRYVKLMAMSHTEKFTRKMRLVQNLEATQEECVDQDVEVVYPVGPEATYVAKAAEILSRQHGPLTICSLPMRRGGKVVAVLTIERLAEKTFTLEEIEIFRLTLDLCTARLIELYENDRWIGAKALAGTRRFFAALVGPEYTWAKLIAIGVAGLVIFLCVAQGMYSVDATFVMQPRRRQVIVAPFSGYLQKVFVKVGSRVTGDSNDPLLHDARFDAAHRPNGTVLALLGTAKLDDKLASAMAQRRGYQKEADIAQRDGKAANQQIALDKARQVAANIATLRREIALAKITSPIGGIVLSGDIRKRVGALVKTGDKLFTVGPLHNLRAELSVPDDEILDIRPGQTGTLASASYPSRKIKFRVERIDPVARVSRHRNVFKVRVKLFAVPAWLRPGMEGVAHINIKKRLYAWIWTHRLVNWIRMKLWF